MKVNETIITIHISSFGKCSLQGNEVFLYTLPNKKKKIKIVIVNRSLRPVRRLTVLLTGSSKFLSFYDTEIQTYREIKKRKEKTSTFIILSQKKGIFTVNITLKMRYRLLAIIPIKVVATSFLFIETIRTFNSLPFLEEFILSVYSESDGTLFLEGHKSLSFLSALSIYHKKFYIIIQNYSNRKLRGVKARISSSPQIFSSNEWKPYDIIHKNRDQGELFIITPKETGNFTLDITLIISTFQKSTTYIFPFEIRVSNVKYMKKLLESNKILSKTEQKELEMLIDTEEQNEHLKLEMQEESKKKKIEEEKQLKIEKLKEKEREIERKKQLEQKRRIEIEKQKKEKEREIEKKKQLEQKRRIEIEKQKKEKEKELKERERKEMEEGEQLYNQLYPNLLEKISNLNSIYDEIRIDDIEKKLPNEIKKGYRRLRMDLITLIEEMILNADINARIRGDFLTFSNKDLVVKPKQQKLKQTKEILISRGGDWIIENKQSVFSYKVKVKNNAKFVLTNIQILLTSIPSGLISQSDRYLIDSLNPNSFESPTFKFSANESCVGDRVKGVVIYTDPKGNPQTVPIQPFKIKYVCNLLVPKPITEENYEKNISSMHEQKISFDCKLPPDQLEPEVSKILKNNNFYLLENLQELKRPDFRKLKAYAEGKYDKKDIALSIIMESLAGRSNKLIVKAMSNKEEKIIDLLRDISIKCDAFKSTPEDFTSLEVICKNCESIITVTDNMKSKDFIICDYCGEEIET